MTGLDISLGAGKSSVDLSGDWDGVSDVTLQLNMEAGIGRINLELE